MQLLWAKLITERLHGAVSPYNEGGILNFITPGFLERPVLLGSCNGKFILQQVQKKRRLSEFQLI